MPRSRNTNRPRAFFCRGDDFFAATDISNSRGAACGEGLSRTISGPHWMRLRFAQSLRTATCCVMPPSVCEDWHLKRVVVGRDSIHFSFFQKEKCGMTQMVSVFCLLFADGGGHARALASCSPPQWGGGELRGSKSRKHRNGKVFGPWPAEVRPMSECE